jgi:hypothetical protein
LLKYVLVILLLFSSSHGYSEAIESKLSDSFSVHGMGQTTCIEVNENSDKKGFLTALKVWLGGYYTAVNAILASHSFEIDDKDLLESTIYIQTMCKEQNDPQLWVAQVTNMFWRTKFKSFESEQTKNN